MGETFMYSFSYIIHIVGVTLWIGSFLGLGYLLKTIVNQDKNIADFTVVIKRIQKWVMLGIMPSLVLVVLSGSFMINKFNRSAMPLYLSIMEQVGSLIILLTIIFISIYSVKLSKKLKGVPLKKDQSLAQISKIYANFLYISAVLGIIIIIIVGLRIV